MTREEAEQEFMESEAVVAGLSDELPVYFLKCTFCQRTIQCTSACLKVRCLYCGTAYVRAFYFELGEDNTHRLIDTNGDAWRKKFV